MKKPINLANVDRAFELAASIAGYRLIFHFYLMDARNLGALRRIQAAGYIATNVANTRTLVASFDHTTCDALGGMQLIRQAISGEREALASSVELGRERMTGRPVPRRICARLLGQQATIMLRSDVPHDPDYQSLFFVIDSIPQATETLTEQMVEATHRVLLAESGSRRSYASVLVPVTVMPWDVKRPPRNLSSGFLSVVTARDLTAGKLRMRVTKQFNAGRSARLKLLKRVSWFGMVPKSLWPFLAHVCAAFATPGESAVVSNLGTVSDPVFDAVGSSWFFVPPARSRNCVTIGIARVGGTLTATVSGFTAQSALRSFGADVFQAARFKTREYTHGRNAC